MSIAALIADMVRAGVDPELIGRTAALLAEREASAVALEPQLTARQARNARYYRRIGLPAHEWQALRKRVFERDGFLCTYCGVDASDAPQCDHVEPLLLGGSSAIENLTTACRPCNSSKSGRSLKMWRGRK